MAKARGSFFGDIDVPTLWSVDDEWSQGEDSVLELLPPDNDFVLLQERITELKGDGITYPMLHYLEHLATLCVKNNLGLYICNFEHFQNKFALANRTNNAVLLDLNYAAYTGERFEIHKYADRRKLYGAYLLAELLNGQRFRGEIFFVTNYPKQLRDELEKKDKTNDANWWPVRAIAGCTVNKVELYDGSLEAFVNYFVHSLPPELKRIDYDVKYVVQIPIAALAGRLSERFVIDYADAKESRPSPWLIPMIREFGLAASLGELRSAISKKDSPHRKRFAERITDEILANIDRWENGEWIKRLGSTGLISLLLGEEPVSGTPAIGFSLCNAFVRFLSEIQPGSATFDRYVTLQDWMNAHCRERLELVLRNLLNEFKGDTSFEFARGKWLPPSGAAVEDLLIVIEFLAKQSKVSRETVEREIVYPLLYPHDIDTQFIDFEYGTIIQEIPIRGFYHGR